MILSCLTSMVMWISLDWEFYSILTDNVEKSLEEEENQNLFNSDQRGFGWELMSEMSKISFLMVKRLLTL